MDAGIEDETIARLFGDEVSLDERIEAMKTPCYDGKDFSVNEEPYCFACHDYEDRIIVPALKGCPRCKTAWYCDAQCQKKHFKCHRELCNQITYARERVELATIQLPNWVLCCDEYSVSRQVYATYNEILYKKIDGLLHARSNLAHIYWNAAYECEIKEVWEEALFHCEKVVNVSADIDQACRYRIPFILLYLNRDDEAYANVQYWLEEGTLGRSRPYPVEPNCRYLDMFKEGTDLDELFLDSPYLVALAIIKMRIIAHYDAILRHVDFAFKQTGGERIQEVRPVVQDILMDKDIEIAKQHEQLHRIFEIMESESPSIRGSILNCVNISEIRRFADLKRAASEARRLHVHIENSIRCFFRVPGAVDMLRRYAVDSVDLAGKRKIV